MGMREGGREGGRQGGRKRGRESGREGVSEVLFTSNTFSYKKRCTFYLEDIHLEFINLQDFE
jgi:hypothetical protein